MSSQDDPVQHDPAAEDLDLLTVREATARIEEEVRLFRERVAELEAGGGSDAEIDVARTRLAELEATADRLENPSVQPPDLYPARRR